VNSSCPSARGRQSYDWRENLFPFPLFFAAMSAIAFLAAGSVLVEEWLLLLWALARAKGLTR
jgi:hypothetical protein